METLILFAVSLAFLLLAMHPFTTYPLSLIALRKRFAHPVRKAKVAVPQTYAVCMCAFNEAKGIREKLENLLEMHHVAGRLDIHIYDDASSDGTSDILREYADRMDIFISPQRMGKTYGMNLLVSRSTASIVIFTDANVLVDSSAVANFDRYFADPEVGCVTSFLTYVNNVDSATSSVGALYWRLDQATKHLESQTGSAMVADGSLFAIRRNLHHPPPEDLFDDIYVSFQILCDGYRIVSAPDVRAFERHTVVAEEEFRRKIRIGCQSFNNHRLLWGRLKKLDGWNVYKYLSHRYLRWIAPFLLAVSAVAGLAGMMAVIGAVPVLVLAGVKAVVLAAGNYLKIRPIQFVVNVLLAFLGTGIGVWDSIRGCRVRVWTPAASIRAKPTAPAGSA
jgi:glycosyltransferase involved in cell wall biosynthesis